MFKHIYIMCHLTCALWKVGDFAVTKDLLITQHVSEAAEAWATHDAHQGAHGSLIQQPVSRSLAGLVTISVGQKCEREQKGIQSAQQSRKTVITVPAYTRGVTSWKKGSGWEPFTWGVWQVIKERKYDVKTVINTQNYRIVLLILV